MADEHSIENGDNIWFWDIARQLKDLMTDISSRFSSILWIETATQQEVDELRQDVENSWQKDEQWNEKSRAKKEKSERKEGKETPRQKIWKFVLSKWMNPSEVTAHFWKNWKNQNQEVVLNWPLFAPGWNPVWWYIENGKVRKNFLTKINEDQTGNFYNNNWIIGCDTDWKMHMFSYRDIVGQEWATIIKSDGEKIMFKRAFQNGPMLVYDWIPQTKNSSKKVDRTAIWFTSTWELRAVQATSVTLWEFAAFCDDQWLSNTMYLDWSRWIAGLRDGETWQTWWWFAAWATWLQFW